MPADKIILSLCAEGTDTVFALSAGKMLAACTEQKRPIDTLYALLPKIREDADVAELAQYRPDIVLVPQGTALDRIESLAGVGAEVIAVGGGALSAVYDNIREIGRAIGRAAEAEKVVTKAEYGFSRLEESLAGVGPVRTAFFGEKDPYGMAGGMGLVQELLRRNKLENIYGDAAREIVRADLSTLRLSDVQLILLPDSPQEFTDEDAIRLGNHTEHALTVFVPGELFRGGASVMRLPAFFEALNEKIRRFSSDNLADRDKPTYF